MDSIVDLTSPAPGAGSTVARPALPSTSAPGIGADLPDGAAIRDRAEPDTADGEPGAPDRPIVPPAGPPDESHPYFDLPYDNSQDPLVPDTRAGRRSAAKAAAAAPTADRPPPPPGADAPPAAALYDPLPPLVIGGAAAAPPVEPKAKGADRGKGRRRGKATEPDAAADDIETITLPPIVPGAMPSYGGSVSYGAPVPAPKKKGPGVAQLIAITMSLAAAALVVYVAFTSYSQTSDASARARSEAAADAKKATPLGAFDIRSATTLAPGQIPATTVPPAPTAHKAVDGSFAVTYPGPAQVVPAKFQAPGSAAAIDGTRTYAAVGDRVFAVDAFEVPAASAATPAAALAAAESTFGNGLTVLSMAPSTVAGRPATLVEVQTANGIYGIATVVVSGPKAFVVYETMPLAAKPATAAAAASQAEYQAFLGSFSAP